jgi:hypothetical protein
MTKTVRVSRRLKWAGGLVASILMIGGAAFAVLQGQATLSGSSISTATSSLMISDDDTNYSSADHGFAFAGIIPGQRASQTEHFTLKNTGDTSLALHMSAGSQAAFTPDADLSKVNIILTPHNIGGATGTSESFSLQSLLDANSSGGEALIAPSTLGQNGRQGFDIQVAMDADAVSGSSATLSNLDLVFTGVGTN